MHLHCIFWFVEVLFRTLLHVLFCTYSEDHIRKNINAKKEKKWVVTSYTIFGINNKLSLSLSIKFKFSGLRHQLFLVLLLLFLKGYMKESTLTRNYNKNRFLKHFDTILETNSCNGLPAASLAWAARRPRCTSPSWFNWCYSWGLWSCSRSWTISRPRSTSGFRYPWPYSHRWFSCWPRSRNGSRYAWPYSHASRPRRSHSGTWWVRSPTSLGGRRALARATAEGGWSQWWVGQANLLQEALLFHASTSDLAPFLWEVPHLVYIGGGWHVHLQMWQLPSELLVLFICIVYDLLFARDGSHKCRHYHGEC